MGRVFQILLYLVLLFLVYLWLSTVFKSCSSDNVITEAVETLEDTAEDIADAGADIADEADEFFEDEDESDPEQLDAEEDWEDEDIYDEDVDYTAEDSDPDPAPAAATPAPTPAPRSNANRSSGGNYLVVVGSYLKSSNATDMKNKLANMGYSAEVVQFDDSPYSTVISGRYNSFESGREASRKLKGKGYDNYVHRKK